MTKLSEIAGFAAVNKPPKTKAHAWMALQSVIEGNATKQQLATLYRYFQPKPSAKKLATDDFAWCAAAVELRGKRPQLENAWCDGQGNLVACDGHTLHVASFDGVEGYYSPQGVLLEGVDNKLAFPYWERLIPKETKREYWYSCFAQIVVVKSVNDGRTCEAYEINGAFVYRSQWDTLVAGRDKVPYCDGGDMVFLPDLGEGRYGLAMHLKSERFEKV